MSLVTKTAPDFVATAVMPDDTFSELRLSAYRGKYVFLLFYPLDFTFVCPSEIIAFDKAAKEFSDRNAQVIGISVDSEYSHYAWRQVPPEKGGIGKISFPLVSDLNKEISAAYGVLFNELKALRGLVLIDSHGEVRHQLINDFPLGRSVSEALRVLDALQFSEEHGEVCPANWQKGEEGMKETAESVASYLAKRK